MTDPVSDPKPVLLELSDIEFDPLNPNEMSDEQLYELQNDIKDNGFDEPIIVCPNPERPGKYRCVSGEHRARAMKTLLRTQIPAYIRDWGEKDAAMYMVRRNMLRGSLNKMRLRELIGERLRGVSIEEMAKKMAFQREQDLGALLATQGRGSAVTQEAFDDVSSAQDDARGELNALKGLGELVSRIYGEFGGTVKNGYIAFELEGHVHYMIKANDVLYRGLSMLGDRCIAENTSMTDVLGKLIGDFVNDTAT